MTFEQILHYLDFFRSLTAAAEELRKVAKVACGR